jgi:hypothetical protein
MKLHFSNNPVKVLKSEIFDNLRIMAHTRFFNIRAYTLTGGLFDTFFKRLQGVRTYSGYACYARVPFLTHLSAYRWFNRTSHPDIRRLPLLLTEGSFSGEAPYLSYY